MVLRTFSKAYGLASLRVGFGIAGKEVVRILMRVKPTWNVGALQTAACMRRSTMKNTSSALPRSLERCERSRTGRSTA